MRLATVAIVGRPNVGKSTLFNRIVGRRDAIVDERPGVTRDRHFGKADWGGSTFWLVDTGGVVPRSADPMHQAVHHQVDEAIAAADVVLFLVDAMEGLHPTDPEIAAYLRRSEKPVLLVANKVDDLAGNTAHLAFYELGMGEPVPVSASTGRGSGDLLDRVVARFPERTDVVHDAAVHVAVIGRPNVGKSSIMNRLLGTERSVVMEEPGTTRDAIDSPLKYHGVMLNFIDTAGLRRRSKVEGAIEFYSALRTERAIERADVCVLVIDTTDGVTSQDLRIARGAWDHGAGLIIAVNKWDLVNQKESNTAFRGERAVQEQVSFLKFVPFLYVSALTGQRVRRLLDLIITVARERSKRVSTAEVNRVLQALLERQQPPQAVGSAVKLLYASQVGTEPPAFAVVSNRPEAIPDSYTRYLQNGFRQAWAFQGAPVRIKFRRRRKIPA